MCLRERAQDVSVDYIDAEKGLPILFEFAVGAIDRGCPLSFVSQFPGEDEILIPPFSYLEVTGAPFSMDTDKGVVTVYPARINCNLKARTIDKIESSRRDELLAQHPYLVAEFERDVPAVKRCFRRRSPASTNYINSRRQEDANSMISARLFVPRKQPGTSCIVCAYALDRHLLFSA